MGFALGLQAMGLKYSCVRLSLHDQLCLALPKPTRKPSKGASLELHRTFEGDLNKLLALEILTGATWIGYCPHSVKCEYYL